MFRGRGMTGMWFALAAIFFAFGSLNLARARRLGRIEVPMARAQGLLRGLGLFLLAIGLGLMAVGFVQMQGRAA